MNNEVLDDSDLKAGEELKIYPSLGTRFVASMLDFLLLSVPVMLLSFSNMFYLQSIVLACILLFVFPIYKVYMEGTYGYTLGKKMKGFKIVKEGGGAMDMKAALVRYLFGYPVLIFSFLSTIYTFEALTEGGIESLIDFSERSAAAQALTPALLTTGTNISSFVYFVALLFIFQGVKRQPLYDRIAKTVCVMNDTQED